MKKWLALVTVMLLVVACGSGVKVHTNEGTTPPPTEEKPTGDENPPTTDTSNNPEEPPANPGEPEPPPPPKVMEKYAVVIGTDWVVGGISTIKLDSSLELKKVIAMADSGDATIRAFGSKAYVVNRYGVDTVQVLDGNDNFKIIADYPYGKGGNLQDIAVIGDKAYVSRLDAQKDTDNDDDILIIKPLTGESVGSIDLTSYTADDGDRLARAAKMLLVGKYLYVVCQDLSGTFVTDTNGKVVVINTDTEEVVTKVDLEGRDPWDIAYSSDTKKIYVSDTGATFSTDTSNPYGGIEVIDPSTNETEGILIDDADIGGTVSTLRIVSGDVGYVMASTPIYSTIIAAFNPKTGLVTNKTFYNSPAYLMDMQIGADAQVLVGETNPTASGVVVLNPDGSRAAGPVDIGASPVSIAVVEVEKK